jgi:hypothetical protein
MHLKNNFNIEYIYYNTMINKFNHGKIYKVTNPNSTKCYYGSTCIELSDRLTKHINSYNSFKKGTSDKVYIYDLFDLHGVDTSIIELIQDFPCNSKQELECKEGEYIRANLNNCFNKSIAGRTLKQYYVDNKEKYQKRQKQYYNINKEKCKLQNKQNYAKNKAKKTQEQALKQEDIIKDYLKNPIKLKFVLEFHFDK